MGLLPNLTGSLSSPDLLRKTQRVFGGLQHTRHGFDGTIYEMENLCGSEYPCLTVRKPRYLTERLTGCHGVTCIDGTLYYAANGLFYAGSRAVGSVSAEQKQFAVLGRRLLIFPDKKYLHTGILGAVNAVSDLSTAFPDAECGDCAAVGTGVLKQIYTFDGSAWTWLEQEFSTMNPVYRGGLVFQAQGTYAGVPAENNTVRAPGVAFKDYFRPGDAVTFTGVTECTANDGLTSIIREIDGDKLIFYENTFTLNGADSIEDDVRVAREVPAFTHVCSSGNRLWGVRGDTVYGSALGDPLNFNVFEGLSTDSYRVESGTQGSFTACCSYLGYPTFFKEDGIFKLYGDRPSEFTLSASAAEGVAADSPKSLAKAGETLFYLSRRGVMAYQGGLPRFLGEAFGQTRLRLGKGGSSGTGYYLSCLDESGNSHLFVFDTLRGLWYRQDSAAVLDFFQRDGLLCFAKTNGAVWTAEGIPTSGEAEQTVPWSFETGDFLLDTAASKHLVRVLLGYTLGAGASFTVKYSADGGEWIAAAEVTSQSRKSGYLSLLPARCGSFRLKLSGSGEFLLSSLTAEYAAGSTAP